MRGAIIRAICALACALAAHAALITGAAYLGWFSSDNATLPELDMTSVDLSFSETPEETATPAAQPPSPAVEPPPPTPPPAVIEPLPPPPAVEFPPPPTVEPPPPPPPTIDLPLPVIEPPPPPVTEQEPEPNPDQKNTHSPPPEETPPPQPQQPPSVEIPPAPAPSQARVKVDKQPSPRRRIKPEYPKGARQRGEEGIVILELDISAEGTVDHVRVFKSCGFPELDQAAIQAAKRAPFNSARQGSVNVPYTVRLPLDFHLKD
ncbi:MAG: energy transducer TonB [Kiritimatiellae bacterium]|nr:energy transducer TonB [Kiritimatiellia bacterium]